MAWIWICPSVRRPALPQQGQQRKRPGRRQPPSSVWGAGQPARRGAVQPEHRPLSSPPGPKARGHVEGRPPRPQHRRAILLRSHAASSSPSPGIHHQMAHLGTQARRRGKQQPARPGAGQGHSGPHPQYARPPERGREPGTAIAWQKGSGSTLRSPCPSSAGQSGKILRRQRPPYPARYRGRPCSARLFRLSSRRPGRTGTDTPQTAQAQHPLLRHHRAAAPPLPPAPQFPPTPSPQEQDMRRGPVYAGGGYRKRRGLVPRRFSSFSWRRRNLRSSSAASLWRCRCARSAPARLPLELEGLLGLRANAGFLWTVSAPAAGPAWGFSPARWTPGRLYRWTKVRPRHADRSHCQTSPSFGSAPKVWRHTSGAPPPPARHAHPEGVGKPDRQPRIAAFHMKLSSLNRSCAGADNQGGRLLTVPGADAPRPRPDYQPGRVFRSAL